MLQASEGLAMASFDMFLGGVFSSDPALKARVNSFALKHLSAESLAAGLQVARQTPSVGLKGRAKVLNELGAALEANPEHFGGDVCRPGNLVDYLLAHAKGDSVELEHLWKVCSLGLGSIWPKQANGFLQGDIWMHSKLRVDGEPGSDLVPFHKLTQWLVYSLIDVLQATLGLKVQGVESLTCLAEYRNGGLLVDAGVIKLKDPSWQAQELNVGTELVVEWRALTVVLIDKVAELLRQKLGVKDLSLAKVLEGGTWQAGRAMAKSLRSDGAPPIRIRSDGNVF
jgi:hypothetical protein